MKTLAIIQARMGSSRLPNKVMMELQDKPILWHVVNRVRLSKSIDEVVVATTESAKDDAIETFAKQNGISFFRGSENDVLDRYYQTAKAYEADVVVRITADCPLADPVVIDKIVDFFKEHFGEYDYVANVIPPTFPDGLDTEVFSFNTLEKAWNEAKYTSEREHVTAYIYKNSEIFRLCNVANDVDYSKLRWTVDTPNDFAFIKEIYNSIGSNGQMFYMEDVIELMNKNPELMAINSDSLRNEGYEKSVAEDKLYS